MVEGILELLGVEVQCLKGSAVIHWPSVPAAVSAAVSYEVTGSWESSAKLVIYGILVHVMDSVSLTSPFLRSWAECIAD